MELVIFKNKYFLHGKYFNPFNLHTFLAFRYYYPHYLDEKNESGSTVVQLPRFRVKL